MSGNLGDAGRKINWSSLYQGNRPNEILGLAKAVAVKVRQVIGFTGRDQEGNKSNQFIIKYAETDAPTLTDFADTEVDTIIIAPRLAKPTLFIHKTKSDPPAVGDWWKIESAQCA